MSVAFPREADVVIVGGGIMGLSLAYQLAKLGQKKVVVLEQSYLCSGASGRNGGGVRAQWSSELNIRLMRESIRLCESFAQEMGINVWFRQGGYLFLARSKAQLDALEKSAKLQNTLGLRTRIVSANEARGIVPELSTEGLVGASFNPDDGVVFPWPFVWGYQKACEALGVTVLPFTPVTSIGTENGAISCVRTMYGQIATRLVVNAAGAWSPEIAKMVGVEMPNKPHRHEICSMEPLKPFLKPLVADLESGLYFSQSMRGEIVGGISNAKVPEGLDQNSSARFLGLYARGLVSAMPRLGAVRVLRQWAGCYDITPDANPILGFVDEVEGFFVMAGFMGHGFMMAPVIGKLCAEHLVEQKDDEVFRRWNLRRFARGELLTESMILG
jgi:sarcosine oxidase subunit beta